MPRFQCKQCGKCCGCTPFPIGLFIRFKDSAQIEYNLEDFPTPSEEKNEKQVLPITKGFICIFLNKEKKCVIYQNRPWICRVYGTKIPCYFDRPEESEAMFKPMFDQLDEYSKKFV